MLALLLQRLPRGEARVCRSGFPEAKALQVLDTQGLGNLVVEKLHLKNQYLKAFREF
jgi:hypothetical protein